tara:strand:- start:286 stop:435 length:150 start_codon:yes stop_codon:yes gene_type:complete
MFRAKKRSLPTSVSEKPDVPKAQTLRSRLSMSALPRKADYFSGGANVGF